MKRKKKQPRKKLTLPPAKPPVTVTFVSPNSWLQDITGHDAVWWFNFIQQRIVAHSRKSRDPNHDVTNSEWWMDDLIKEVHRTFPRSGSPYDGNMRMAAVVGCILTFWYLRVARAKSYDPRRPIVHRKRGMESWTKYALMLVGSIVDESQDAKLFNGQHWDPPYSVHAVDGVFT